MKTLAPLLTSLLCLTGCSFTFIATTNGTSSGSAATTPANGVASNQPSQPQRTAARPRVVAPARPAPTAKPVPATPGVTTVRDEPRDRPSTDRPRVPSNPSTPQVERDPRTAPSPGTVRIPPSSQPPQPTPPTPTFDIVAGFVVGRPTPLDKQNGIWVYEETTGWHVRMATADRVSRKFKGRIFVQEGAISGVTAFWRYRDGVKVAPRELDFNVDTDAGFDTAGLDFEVSGASCVQFELSYEGQLDPNMIRLGLNQIHPKTARFQICR